MTVPPRSPIYPPSHEIGAAAPVGAFYRRHFGHVEPLTTAEAASAMPPAPGIVLHRGK
jgi:hypothetical protein